MGASCLHICKYYGIDILERFSESGFYGNDGFHPKAVRAVHGNGSFTGGAFCGGGRLYDLVSAKGNWGKGRFAALYFLFLYRFFLFRHYSFSNLRTACAVILHEKEWN